jgi:hypothetical protein
MKRVFVIAALVLLVAATVLSQATANDARLGVWKLNLAKSTFDPALNLAQSLFDPAIGPPPSNETLVYEARADGVTSCRAVHVDDNGRHSTRSFTGRYDGKEHFFPGKPEAGTFVLTIVDEYTTTSVLKKAGTVVQTTRSVVSKDGRTLTLTITDAITSATTVEVFDRQ